MKALDISDIVQIIGTVIGDSAMVGCVDEDTQLLGTMPEMDSMAIVNVILALEAHYGFHVDDEEVEHSIFESVGSLFHFVENKLSKLDYQRSSATQG